MHVNNIVTDDPFDPLNPDSVYRKILIEEYTGHRCTNCPAGHAKLAELSSLFGDTLVAVCIHAGKLARPNQSGLYVYDFRIPEGEQLFDDFGLDPVPVAIVNRTRFEDWALMPDRWQNAVLSIVRDIYAGIQIKATVKGKVLTVITKTTMLKDYNSPLQLSVFLIEDHVIRPQMNGAQNIEQYQHNHVLRASLNGTYGTPLIPNGILPKDSASLFKYELNFGNKDWNIENATVVVFLHDPVTREVLQVEVAEISESK
jgi:hypothetical protein